jgi:hypothetical protein
MKASDVRDLTKFHWPHNPGCRQAVSRGCVWCLRRGAGGWLSPENMRLPSPQSECYHHAIALCWGQSEGLSDNIFRGLLALLALTTFITFDTAQHNACQRTLPPAALSRAAKRCAFPNIAHSIFSRVHVALMVVAVHAPVWACDSVLLCSAGCD